MGPSSRSVCLDPATVTAFVSGTLDADALQRVEHHLDRCEPCFFLIAMAARGLGSPTPPAEGEPQGATLGIGDLVAQKYCIEELVGRGGMGVVWAARHVDLGHRVAIKVLTLNDETASLRFLREARACAELVDEHIARVFDFGHLADGVPYLVMEHLVGRDLASRLTEGTLSPAVAVDYAMQVCAALERAHAASLVHRDLKPANLFLTERPDGTPCIKVLDFGVAKLTDEAVGSNLLGSGERLTLNTTLLGSPHYMSPEQIGARPDVDARSDLWSVGVILYESLTGRLPFDAPNLAGLALAITREAPPALSSLAPSVSPALDAVVMRCLEKAAGDRHASATALKAALQAALPAADAALGPAQARSRPIGGSVERRAARGSRTQRRSTLLNLGDFVGRRAALDAIEASFRDRERATRVVLTGEPGVGKSHLANAYGLHSHHRYLGGTWFVPFNADPGLELSKLIEPLPNEPIGERARRWLESIDAPTLLIYDNVASERELSEWLPPPNLPAHVLVTSTEREWSRSLTVHEVGPLSAEDARSLVALVGGERVAEQFGAALIERALGVAIQLKADAVYADYELRHQRVPAFGSLAEATTASFARAFSLLSEDARAVLRVASLFNEARVPRDALTELFCVDCGWSEARLLRGLDAAIDRSLVSPLVGTLRMHGLIAAFLRGLREPSVPAHVVRRHAARFVEAARRVASAPADATLRGVLASFPEDSSAWPGALAWPAADVHDVGFALYQTGRFGPALPWFERAIAAKEAAVQEPAAIGGERYAPIDPDSLGQSLSFAGECWSSLGRFDQARLCFERAVIAKQKGDVEGRVDHLSVGQSLHQVGACSSKLGDCATARPWFERAVSAKEKGDIHGRVDSLSVGNSLHQVGYCWSAVSSFEAARPWFERAVSAKEKGDLHGRVDHESSGMSLHQVGYCWFGLGDFDSARPWFERAVAAKEKGDIHGRVDPTSLGISLSLVGSCWLSTQRFEAARPWFERAVAAKEKGDIHGRIDHESVGKSLSLVGLCWLRSGDIEQARLWFERAVGAKEKGDIHGRVDALSLGISLHQAGHCWSRSGEFERARPWFERAVAAKEKGDLYGRIDSTSVGISLNLVGACWTKAGDFAQARPWFERAVAAKEKGDTQGRVDSVSLAISLSSVGDCWSRLGERDKALPWFERAVAAEEKSELRPRPASLAASLEAASEMLDP